MGELKGEREKSKNKGKEEISNPLLLLPKGHTFTTHGCLPQKREFSTLANNRVFLTIFPFLGWLSVAYFLGLLAQLGFFSQGDWKEGRWVWGQHYDFGKITY